MRGDVTVGTSVVSITDPNGDAPYWENLYIANISGATIYIQWTDEPDALTTANGFPIAAGTTQWIACSEKSPRRQPIKLIAGSAGLHARYNLQ